MSITLALERALESVDVTPADAATVALALVYANAIDTGAEDLSKLGPKLLAALESLLMTPKARTAILKGGEDEQPANPVDALRAKRRERYATAMDATAS